MGWGGGGWDALSFFFFVGVGLAAARFLYYCSCAF
jgi:hypothetical protein